MIPTLFLYLAEAQAPDHYNRLLNALVGAHVLDKTLQAGQIAGRTAQDLITDDEGGGT